ncbi:2-oxoglutarate dehydrogenase E1 subunit family protein, partial [Nostocoides australiense]|uniref:2-oxoglutarate dehydrogenase E1 subunit family protein n=1 Tax=Nostocoides australiense TaxID=99480 RepID=UPI0006610FDD
MADPTPANPMEAFGPNEWLVDELYESYLKDRNSVDRAWWDFFSTYKLEHPHGNGTGGNGTRPAAPAAPTATAPEAP